MRLYKEKKDANLMELMKRLTVIKQKIEKRLKRPSFNSNIKLK